MEQQRLLILVSLAFVLFLIWDAWQKDYGPHPQSVTATASSTQAVAPAGGSKDAGADIPTADTTAKTAVAEVPAEHNPTQGNGLQTATRVHVNTDVLQAEIDTVGGDLRVVNLPKYPISEQTPDKPFQLMSDTLPHLFIEQSGFAEKAAHQGILTKAPNHTTAYQASKTDYELGAGQDSVDVTLNWKSPEGVEFAKVYHFQRGSYLIHISYVVKNTGNAPWQGNIYHQLRRTDTVKSKHAMGVSTYTGGVIYSEEHKYEKIKFDEMKDKDLSRTIKGGWAAMIEHYFVGALVPDKNASFDYYSRDLKNLGQYILGMKASDATDVAPGAERQESIGLYVGPKTQRVLEGIAPGLELTVDYGFLTFLAKPLFWLLKLMHSLTSNWGWSIILLTIIVKGAFYKLSETSYKSMAHMKRVAPRLSALKERYAGDKQRMQQAQMELFKKEKINPLGGCLPILVQIPVFIALYWSLLESVELRQAPWIFWLTDLSSKDPYYVLPVLMGITMLIQQKLNPTPPDPIQAKVMMALPIVFTFFFASFPSGLVLYWVVSNTLSIAQQWYITRVVLERNKPEKE